ncbi:DUF4168 domain-containing protein [Roseovarius sp. SCSIO 43702]|uniref:DUF4168 domain-containing protein n=1 Tax=Roseovarius sp. SCSIO 43702 TaxID=2823043 RepID=UPI001C72B8FE|nr:DUF4168 domain-containing protein [Roseovarius sp. SCSIO 43702]QYX57626.1 DUF4168 domain-containing protein [Roseovarius sp. SCSIO 43702]
MISRTPLAAALAAAFLALGAPLAAQTADAPVVPEQIEAADVTETQVSAFVDAVMAVEKVRLDYGPRIQAEEDADKRKALAEEATLAAQDAIENTEGMTTAEYLGIGQAASGDRALNERIIAELQERQGDAEAAQDEAEPDSEAEPQAETDEDEGNTQSE